MRRLLLLWAVWLGVCVMAHGQSTLDNIGVTELLSVDPTLTGSEVIVAQVELAPTPTDFEVSPDAVGVPGKLLTYISTKGAAVKYPNLVGSESTHAEQVAQNFYVPGMGDCTGVEHVDNYETDYFFADIIARLRPIPARVVNQSFEFGTHNAAQDQAYDNYIAVYHNVVASGVGNGGAVLTPADCYNGIGVGAYGGSSSKGPTADGRCKPDITAPQGVTSFSTPLVAGAAAVLIQAGRREPAYVYATDSRTIKALLLTGANKPGDWGNTDTSPLDVTYGAGIVDVFNSYLELKAGRHGPTKAETLRVAGHPPVTSGSAIVASTGWDYRGIVSSTTGDGVNHYLINTTESGALICTVVWNKGYAATRINNLALYVYDSSGSLVAQSVSTVDNVQHVYATGLGPGTYDIEVAKVGGKIGTAGVVTGLETYSIAWDFGR